MSLKGKVAVVTGGAGGIGKAVVEKLARAGARIFVVGRNAAKITETATVLKKSGFDVRSIRADVSQAADAKRVAAWVARKEKKIDILVNCAGIQAPIGPFAGNNIKQWERNIQTNLLGTVFMAKAFLPYMLKKGSGSIINFSGGGSTSSRPNFSAYAVAKTGVVRFTEVLADEVKKYGVRVNAVAPGAVNTAMLTEVLRAGKNAGVRELKDARRRAKAGGTPPELAAELVLFLASSKSDGLTGRLISAPWDGWRRWNKSDIQKIMKSDRLTLRRIK